MLENSEKLIQLEVKKENIFSKYSWLTFPLFLFWLIGVVIGIYGSKVYFEHKLTQAVQMKRIMIQAVVYDLMVFDKTK